MAQVGIIGKAQLNDDCLIVPPFADELTSQAAPELSSPILWADAKLLEEGTLHLAQRNRA
jgi:hypothetical protein